LDLGVVGVVERGRGREEVPDFNDEGEGEGAEMWEGDGESV
jgi:hypothetical protein